MDEATRQSNKRKLVWGLMLLIGPTALIVVTLIAYAIINLVTGTTSSASSDLFSTSTTTKVVNIMMYILGAIGILGFVPGVIGGIVLLASRRSQPVTVAAGTYPSAAHVAPGRTLSIVGLVFAFVGLAVPGLVLSIIGFSRSKRTGKADVIATLGIIFNGLSIVLVIGYIAYFAFLYRETPQDYQDNSSPGDNSIVQPDSETQDPDTI